mmetsp:Transcript_8755/g.14541  ORF Transcript_8755/g.14541 Transcript_8755/m.14541 type:complete len:474 (-) Transcript_8755:115-1536(-)|eukprot:CAMPEP_0119023100 /NCGR_PEP_ID=MMETSP1176-20130426/29303_1 /TAXON_ID=265551 /ORGANISM="Synedropsis recta cf, Strain CCMP1620" /LENGTH=473 /DNA_ID=CAMNT_0006978091 /DNA_START=153 /DNA_END=1574 /DNA_ORIENTATION=-
MRLFRTDRRGNPIPWFQRKRPTRRHPHLPQIFYLVKNRSWPQVVQRARSHPHEICVQEDVSGNTCLHIACRLNPPEDVVQALREASSITNAEAAIPLHVAATHRCSADAIQVLLEDSEFSPSAALTRMGRAPIHYACFSFRGLSLPAFQILLEATLKTGHVSTTSTNDLEDLMEDDEYSQFDDGLGPKMNVVTLRDLTGQTPLGLLFRRYRERVRIVIQSMERLHPLAAALRVQADLGELWSKARWIVTRLAQDAKPFWTMREIESPGEQAIAQEAANWACEHFCPIKQQQHKRNFRIVHASVSLTGYGCPPEMIRLALSIHPHQAKEMDEDGSLPIHVCAMAPSLVYNDSNRNDDDSSFISEFSFLTNTTSPTPNAFDKVFKILLQQYPASARVPHGVSGKLPLNLALDGRTWEDGIQTLLDYYPAALESKKWFPMGLYPWMLSRVGSRPSARKSRNAVFELLRAKPDLVMI